MSSSNSTINSLRFLLFLQSSIYELQSRVSLSYVLSCCENQQNIVDTAFHTRLTEVWTLASGAGRGARSRVDCTALYCTVLFCTVLTCNQFVSLHTTASFIWSWMGYYTYICRLQISNNFGGPQGFKKILHYLNHLPYWYLHNQQSAKCLINSGPGHLCILSRTMCHLSMIFWLRKHPHKIWFQFHL